MRGGPTGRLVDLYHLQHGWTLVELLIVLMILAMLLGTLAMRLVGFRGRGGEAAFTIDRRIIQLAVDAYYTNFSLRGTALGGRGYNPFPTDYNQDGAPGLVSRATNVLISMPVLVKTGYLRALPESASSANGGDGGHYVWIIDGATGLVYGCSGGSQGSTAHTWTVTSIEGDCRFDGQFP